MKKPLKIALIAAAAALLLAVGIGLYFASPLLAMCPAPTGLVPGTDNLTVLALRNNRNALYFVDTGEGWLLIDAGSDAGKIEADLAALGIDPLAVNWILLTHSDYDHVATLPLFPRANIYMGEDELGLLDGTVNRSGSGGNSLPDGIDLANVRLLRDNAKLELGNIKVVCVKAPGHTPGSMAYLVDETYLFTGDAFRYHNGKLSLHPFTMDKALAKASYENLPIYGDNITVLTSHYGFFTVQPTAL